MPRAVLLPRCPLPHLGTRHSPPISASSSSSSSSPRLILARPGRLALCRAASLSAASWKGHAVDDGPSSVELEPVVGEEGFDRIVEEAQRVGEVVVVLWMANWCRKCIYLKPKLEKLAATYYPRIRFYSVDVNSVPQRLVSRAGIIKMPTIQIWKDCNKQGEVIGGHKAWLVVSEVQQLLENQE